MSTNSQKKSFCEILEFVLLSYALCKQVNKKTSHDHLNELIFEICGLKDSLNYCGLGYEEIYFDFQLVQS